MSCMPDMTSTSLATAVVPRIGKIIKNGLRVFKRENLLQNGILIHFVLHRDTKLKFTQTKN